MSKVCTRIHGALVGIVLACGLAAGLSAVLLFSVVDGLANAGTWFWAGFPLGPFVLAAAGVRVTRRSVVASCLAYFMAALIIREGGEFTSDCIRIRNVLLSGGELKDSWQSGFNVKWGMTFAYCCYLPAMLGLGAICILADLKRKAAISSGKDTNDSPKVG